MRGRTPNKMDYEWPEAERDLSMGFSPDVVAARLGESVEYLLEVADNHGWPVTWKGPSREDIAVADILR